MTTREKFEAVRLKVYDLALKNLHGEEQEIARFLMDFLEEGQEDALDAYHRALREEA